MNGISYLLDTNIIIGMYQKNVEVMALMQAKDWVKNNFPDSSHVGAALAAIRASVAAKAAPTHNGLSPTNREVIVSEILSTLT